MLCLDVDDEITLESYLQEVESYVAEAYKLCGPAPVKP